MKKLLKEHKQFRNQLIVVTILLLINGLIFKSGILITFSVIFGLIALYNIFTYKQNLKDYERYFNNTNK